MKETQMKVLNNWRAVVEKEKGVFENALPLPGCTAEGNIDGFKKFLQNAYFDFSKAEVTVNADDQDPQTYKLGEVNQNYIQMLNDFIQMSKENGIEIGE